jgi:arylsulfatase A-like enzyme
MYDVSMRTPFMAIWPGHIRTNTVSDVMVQNIDYAPTFLQVAGITVPSWMQGISQVPVMTGTKKTIDRKVLYYHFYEYGADHTVLQHLGIRGERYKLIYFYTANEWELYDLAKDPGEQKNLANNATYKPVLEMMKKELAKQRDKYDDHEPAGVLK